MSPHYPPDYSIRRAVPLCNLCGRPLTPRDYKAPRAGFSEVQMTAWLCRQCDLVPDPVQPRS